MATGKLAWEMLIPRKYKKKNISKENTGARKRGKMLVH